MQMGKIGDHSVMELPPEDMPQFLNDLAHSHFEKDFDIRMQLAQCAAFIKTMNAYLAGELSDD